MNYDLTKPCADCPFRKEGGILLRRARIMDIAAAVTSNPGTTFSCHKTVQHHDVDDDDDASDRIPGADEQHCAGALLFAKKQNALGFPQMQRIAMRLRLFDPNALTTEAQDTVWDSVLQWLRGGAVK
jgi:hypothetical protein